MWQKLGWYQAKKTPGTWYQSFNKFVRINSCQKKEKEIENGRKDTAYASIAQEVNGDEDNYPDVTSN